MFSYIVLKKNLLQKRQKRKESVSIYKGIKTLWLTDSIFEVLMSNQFKVLFYGFSGQSVLSENKVLSVDESVYFTHRHVWQEVL